MPRLGARQYHWQTDPQNSTLVEIDFDPELEALLSAYQAGDPSAQQVTRMRARLAAMLPAPLLVQLLRDARGTLTIASNAAEIFLLPWEELEIGHAATRLVERFPDLRFRYLVPTTTRRTSAVPGRVCFAWSEAAGPVPATSMQQQLARLGTYAPTASSDWCLEVANASLTAIVEAMTTALAEGHPITVLHLLCHGVQVTDAGGHVAQGLALDGDAGGLVGDRLVQALSLAAVADERVLDHLQLVVLTVCRSGAGGPSALPFVSPALALHGHGVPSVIAWSQPVYQNEASGISRLVYSYLLGFERKNEGWVAPCTTAEAFSKMRQRLASEGMPVAGLKLYDHGRATRPFLFDPFPGGAPFTTADARFFAGREAEVAALTSLVEAPGPALIGLVGPSGIGKTSLLQAGLAPWAMARGMTVLSTTSDTSQALALALTGQRVLLLVDDVEQLSDAATSVLAAELHHALACAPSLRVVVAVRPNDAARLRVTQRLRLAAPSRDALVAMLIEPLRRAGVPAPSRPLLPFVDRFALRPGRLALFQIAVADAWHAAAGDPAAFAPSEPLVQLVDVLERLFAGLPEASEAEVARWQLLMKRLFVALVEAGREAASDAAIARPEAELIANATADEEASRPLARALLRMLARARVLVAAEQIGLADAELIRNWSRLRLWIGEVRAQMRALAELETIAQRWQSSEQPAEGPAPGPRTRRAWLVHRGPVLAQARGAIGDLASPRVNAYLAACEAREQREQRARRWRRGLGLAAVVSLLAMSTWAWLGYDRLDHALERASHNERALAMKSADLAVMRLAYEVNRAVFAFERDRDPVPVRASFRKSPELETELVRVAP